MGRVLVLVVLVVGLMACGEAASPEAAQQESPAATAAASASQVPASPVAAATPVTFVNGPLTVAPDHNATLKVKTAPAVSCSIEVDYASGPSTAAGLVPKTSDGTGNVSWTWKVGARTTPGNWPITVSCGTGSAQTHITVT